MTLSNNGLLDAINKGMSKISMESCLALGKNGVLYITDS